MVKSSQAKSALKPGWLLLSVPVAKPVFVQPLPVKQFGICNCEPVVR